MREERANPFPSHDGAKNELKNHRPVKKTAISVERKLARDPYLTPKQVADFLQVSISTVYRRSGDGSLKYFKVGILNRYRLEDVINFAEKWKPRRRKKIGQSKTQSDLC